MLVQKTSILSIFSGPKCDSLVDEAQRGEADVEKPVIGGLVHLLKETIMKDNIYALTLQVTH